MWRRLYVDVLAEHTRDGSVVPRIMYWPDGRPFEMCVKCSKPCAATKAGGHGIRYTVDILAHERYLFQEEERFFVEYDGPVLSCEEDGI